MTDCIKEEVIKVVGAISRQWLNIKRLKQFAESGKTKNGMNGECTEMNW
jgi:hypothetical protein